MAYIFKAELRGRVCVAKKLKHGIGPESQTYKDLVMELDILTTMGRHPNLVEFYGANISNTKSPILFEEYIRGPSLEKFMSQKWAGLEHHTIYSWSLDILRALDFLHNRNPIIIHRDVKPTNLLLTDDLSTIKLIDFGLSKKVSAAQRNMPHRGHVGTRRYMAPEIAHQITSSYTEKADIYSAGLIIYFIASGCRPSIPPIDNLASRPDLRKVEWSALHNLIATMWAHNQGQRPSAGECIRTLSSIPDKPSWGEGVAPRNLKGDCCVFM